MRESLKSLRRMWVEDAQGIFPWRNLFKGKIIDIGCCDCPLPFPNVTGFDTPDGDANRLSTYFPPDSFDLAFSSQSLEHMIDPTVALHDWLKVLKPGGHIIVLVPDWVAYEGMTWPSRWNLDHKSSWSMIYRGGIAPIHVHIPTFLAGFTEAEVVRAGFVDTNYCYKTGTSKDQTFDETAQVEAWNQFVLKKK